MFVTLRRELFSSDGRHDDHDKKIKFNDEGGGNFSAHLKKESYLESASLDYLVAGSLIDLEGGGELDGSGKLCRKVKSDEKKNAGWD